MKKTISVLLSFILLVSSFTLGALPVFAEDDVYDAVINAAYEQTTARAMLDLVNELRLPENAWYWDETDTNKVYLSNLSPLSYDYELEQTAMLRASEIAVYFSHTRPNGKSCFTSYVGGYRNAGENIAYGYDTYESVFTAFAEENDSYAGQGHRRNMLGVNFTAFAVGHAVVNGVHYWVQELRRPLSSEPYTEPVNAPTDVTFPFSKSVVTYRHFTVSQTEFSLGLNDTAAFPEITCTLNSRTVRPAEITAASANENVAVVQNGVIVPTGVGGTTVTVSAFGEDVALSVVVHTQKDVHEWDEGVVTLEPTCSTTGICTYTCLSCGAVMEKPVPKDPDAHVFRVTVHEPTCVDDGYTSHACTLCRYGYSDDIVPALGHIYAIRITPATCMNDGITTYTCTRCGDKFTKNPVPAFEHVDEDGDDYCDYGCGTYMGELQPNCACGKTHTGPFASIIIFFHRIVYFFRGLFG
ncbi:MAG: CAP domain-containing protein [Clostridia bacterium]|nr:CAP domain-containing protein [Clostridia bacterium]